MPSKPRSPHPGQAFADHCCDVLASVGPCTARRMFGGWGIHCDGLMIGLIANETLHLKVDAQTKAQFVAAGGRPFVYHAPTKSMEMSYVSAPEEAIDARHFMAPWARLAMEAALRSANAKPPKKAAAVLKPQARAANAAGE